MPVDAASHLVSPHPNGNGVEASTNGREHTPAAEPRVAVTHVNIWSIARLAIIFWGCVGIAALVGLTAAWALLRAAGVLEKFEDFVADLTGLERFELISDPVFVALAVLVLVAVVCSTVLTVLAGACYNALARTTGGLEVSYRAD